MTKGAYYNEFDPEAAQWLRNLIAAGEIAPGEVDSRDLWDVQPDDLKGFTQVHLCAGIGIWSGALRDEGWTDDQPVWTASFPCQPFSAAGKGLGVADERHLWPAGFHLMRECRPAIVLGEQVASRDAEPWADLVQADVEALGYAFGCVPFPSAGVGAPILRDRLYWMACAEREGLQGHWAKRELCEDRRAIQARRGGVVGGVASSVRGGSEVADLDDRVSNSSDEIGQAGEFGMHGVLGDYWRRVDWLACRDDKWRPVERGTFPLAHGDKGRVVKLRAYGNAINWQAARAFVRSVMDVVPI